MRARGNEAYATRDRAMQLEIGLGEFREGFIRSYAHFLDNQGFQNDC